MDDKTPLDQALERREARNMGLTAQDLARLGPSARRQVLEKLGLSQEKGRKYHNQPDTRGKLHFGCRWWRM